MTVDTRLSGPPESPALRALADALDARLGLSLPPGGAESIARRLRNRIRERAFDGLPEYIEYLIHGAPEEAWAALAETLTGNESRVFEAPHDFLPLFELTAEPRWGRYARGAPEERFRALSAGCGTGEEAYSIAMALEEVSHRLPAFRFEVMGADLSRRAVAAARRGVYGASRFEALPPELRERHLVPQADGRIAVGELRRHTRFALSNLAQEGALVSLGDFDLVLARGVLPALTPRARRVALANLARCLKPGGVLLLGPEESLERIDLELLPVRWGERHAYERPGPGQPAPLAAEDRAAEPATALVAHRSPLVRRWLALLLGREGYRVETAADGIEALTRATYGRARSVYWLERTLPPDGGAAVAARLIATGSAEPERVRLLSPRAGGLQESEDADEPGLMPLPLSRADSGIPAAGVGA
jgi:chemotaxis protein methyltransferase CheR